MEYPFVQLINPLSQAFPRIFVKISACRHVNTRHSIKAHVNDLS